MFLFIACERLSKLVFKKLHRCSFCCHALPNHKKTRDILVFYPRSHITATSHRARPT